MNQIKSLCKTYFQSKRKNNGLTGNKKFILQGSERESASLQKYAGVFNGQHFEYSVIVGDIKNLDVLKKGDIGYVISRLEP